MSLDAVIIFSGGFAHRIQKRINMLHQMFAVVNGNFAVFIGDFDDFRDLTTSVPVVI